MSLFETNEKSLALNYDNALITLTKKNLVGFLNISTKCVVANTLCLYGINIVIIAAPEFNATLK